MSTPQDPREPDEPDRQPGGGMPPPPPLSPDEDGRSQPAMPTEVRVSFWIWIGSAVLNIVFNLLALTGLDELREEFRREGQANGLSPDEVDSVFNTAIGVTLVVALAIQALYVLFAFKMRDGRNWARAALTVLAVLNLLLFASAGGGNGMNTLFNMLPVVATVLLFLPNSNAYFQAHRRH
ncbi:MULTISPECIES: hypothetical protein [Actinoalloteichus]|nr:hypothetical protein [Actinoalloteichus caeruleus]